MKPHLIPKGGAGIKQAWEAVTDDLEKDSRFSDTSPKADLIKAQWLLMLEDYKKRYMNCRMYTITLKITL